MVADDDYYGLEKSASTNFPELYGISQYQRRNLAATSSVSDQPPLISKQKVVEVIDKFRKGMESDVVEEPSRPTEVRTDNVSTEEVVGIINEQRKEQKLISYQKFVSPPNFSRGEQLRLLSPKVEEIKSILFRWEKRWNGRKSRRRLRRNYVSSESGKVRCLTMNC